MNKLMQELESRLQKRKLIEYSRGNIRIVDPAGLEAASCSCYQATKSPQPITDQVTSAAGGAIRPAIVAPD